MEEKAKYFAEAANSAIGIFIKHNNNTDVCFFASGAVWNTPEALCLRGYWLNLASQSKYIIDSDVISITRDKLEGWEEIPDPRNA